MTTSSDVTAIEPYWFGRLEAEVRAAAEARAEQWAPVPGFTRYLWSDKGRLRRSVNGQVMKTKVLNSGYEAVNVIRDRDGKQVTVTVHQMVLLAHHPAFRGLDAFPEGLETRHNPATGPLFNAYPEGLWPGTKKQNAADKGAQEPQHPCRNAPACGNLVVTPGRRCAECVPAVGREAGELLRLGMPSPKVAARFGYGDDRWVLGLARKFGGWEGTNAEARAQRPTLRQRVQLAARRGSDAL